MSVVKVKLFDKSEQLDYISNIKDINIGDYVVINYNDILTIAQVEEILDSSEQKDDMIEVVRKATQKDNTEFIKIKKEAIKIKEVAQQKADALNVKLIVSDVDVSLDKKKIMVYFTSKNRVDFRQLAKDLANEFHSRIELRQIYKKYDIYSLGLLSSCGQESCCKRLGQSHTKANIKMAKTQNLPINMDKLEGCCGKLMCCLSFEKDFYAQSNSEYPKVGATIKYNGKDAIVVARNYFKENITLKMFDEKENVEYAQITLEEYKNVSDC